MYILNIYFIDLIMKFIKLSLVSIFYEILHNINQTEANYK